jgi:hypothetical protein
MNWNSMYQIYYLIWKQRRDDDKSSCLYIETITGHKTCLELVEVGQD